MLNLDQVKQDACKVLALVKMIEKSKAKELNIACDTPYFGIFGTDAELHQAVARQNAVTQRLYGYLNSLHPYPYGKQGIYNIGGPSK
jgi:hypothetical protein